MKAWSRGRTLLAGSLLIVLANGAAWFGVWSNRSGEPESQLTLTERELMLPFGGHRREENSGLALRLVWRVADRERSEYYSGSGGTPEWLDAARMAELGFDARADDANEPARRNYLRQQAREALLVLELGGPAWQQAVDQARENAARHAAAAIANAGDKKFAERARQARTALEREEKANSRLFVIDVGRDLATLRAKHPERSRHMIIKGTVRPHFVSRDKRQRLTGYVGALAVASINVPHELRPAIESLPARQRHTGEDADIAPRYAAHLALGQRLEPWVVALSPLPNSP